MAKEPENTSREEVEDVVEPARAATPLFGLIVRFFARLWVISLLLAAAAFGGIAVYQLFQMQAQLSELRKEPGADAYAVVAYRRELERQIRANAQNWREDAVPSPPPRPRLLEEIDLARPPVRERVRSSTELAPISAPQ